jgi:hypothetical protein
MKDEDQMRKALLLWIILCGMISALSGLDWRRQDSLELGYSVSYPTDWVIISNQPENFVVTPPADEFKKAKTYIRVAVTGFEPNDMQPDLKQLKQSIINQFMEYAKHDSISTFQVLGEVDTEVNEIPAYYVVTYGIIQQTEMFFRISYLRKNQRLYQMIIACPRTKFEELSTMISVAEGLFSVK